MKPDELISKLASKQASDYFEKLYGNKPEAISFQVSRYQNLIRRFTSEFSKFENLSLFTTPGRTEVGGNHTDHNAGRVLAAAVDLDIIAVASPSNDNQIIVFSEGYPEICINILELEARNDEKYSSAALVRGVCARLHEMGYHIGGFRASLDGRVPKGSGLSSSAAFEVLMVTILNQFYNNGVIDNTVNAQIAQYAENEYFGKPCGLMDQTTCAYGGMVFIDFKDFTKPVIEKINFDFSQEGYTILIIDTGGNHADLNDDYEALENEMKSVARSLGGSVMREFNDIQVIENLKQLRTQVSDRAILRALHFYNDDQRVVKQVEALKSNRIIDFLNMIKDSGESSWMLCQNCYSSKYVEKQGISIALAVTAQLLIQGAWRVHGGGFAGTIQVFISGNQLDAYLLMMRKIFGDQAIHEIFIRSIGTAQINL
jgi:galactokinase